MGETDRMQRTIYLPLPEFHEFKKSRMVRRQIIILPDKAVEHVNVVGHTIEKFRGGQPISFEHHLRFRHSGFFGHCPAPFLPLLSAWQKKIAFQQKQPVIRLPDWLLKRSTKNLTHSF